METDVGLKAPLYLIEGEDVSPFISSKWSKRVLIQTKFFQDFSCLICNYTNHDDGDGYIEELTDHESQPFVTKFLKEENIYRKSLLTNEYNFNECRINFHWKSNVIFIAKAPARAGTRPTSLN